MSAIEKVTGAATLALAGAAGVLAAVATSEVAVETGAVSDPRLAWLLPVVLEGGAVTAGLLAHRRAQAGLNARLEVAVLAVLLGLAIVVNAAHADAGQWLGDWLGVLLASSPPAVLFAATTMRRRALDAAQAVSAQEAEETRKEADREAARRGEQRERAAERRRARAQEKAVSGERAVSAQEPAPVARAEQPTARGLTAERRAEVLRIERDEPGLDHTALGQRLGVTRDTARRWRERVAS